MKKLFNIFKIFIVFVSCVSCSGKNVNNEISQEAENPEILYSLAMIELKNENYDNALKQFKDINIKLRHVENLPVIDKEIKVLISKKRIKSCRIPQIQLENLDILELRIRCEIYNCSELIIGIDPGGPESV